MSQGSRVALAVIGGYALGRRRKLKLALGLGALLLGKKANLFGRKGSLSASGLNKSLTDQLGQTPGVGALKDQIRGELANAGKAAVVAVSNDLVQSLADNLHARTERLQRSMTGVPGTGGGQEQADRAGAEQDEETGTSEREPSAGPEGRRDATGEARQATRRVRPQPARPRRPSGEGAEGRPRRRRQRSAPEQRTQEEHGS